MSSKPAAETTPAAEATATTEPAMVKVVDTEGGRIRIKEVTQAEAEQREIARAIDITDTSAEVIDRLDTQFAKYIAATDGLIELGLANTRPQEAAKMWADGWRPIDEADAKNLRGFEMMEVPGFGRVPVVQDTMLMGREKKFGDGVRDQRQARYNEVRKEMFRFGTANEINRNNGGGDLVTAEEGHMTQESIDADSIYGMLGADEAILQAARAGQNVGNGAVQFGFNNWKGSTWEPKGPSKKSWAE